MRRIGLIFSLASCCHISLAALPSRSYRPHIPHGPYMAYSLSQPSTPMPEDPGFLPPRGNYQDLLAYQKSEIVFDLTWHFCHRFLKKGDRTIDQMIQAARSGKQNIAEGSKAAQTSAETEIKLTNVARASLEELLIDYQDYLRVRSHPVWEKNSKEALYVRKLGNKPHTTYEAYRPFVETRPAGITANIAICLLHQTNYLLDQYLRRLQKDFVQQGGLRERMTKARLDYRNRPNPNPEKD